MRWGLRSALSLAGIALLALILTGASGFAADVNARPAQQATPAGGKTLQIGGTAVGELVAGESRERWLFAGQADVSITVRIDPNTPGIAPLVELYSVAPDDPGVDVNLLGRAETDAGLSALLPLTLPDDGLYAILVWGGGAGGAYQITLLRELIAPTATPVPLPTGTRTPLPATATPTVTPTRILPAFSGDLLTRGQPVQGVFSALDEVHRYAFFGQSGERMTVGMFPDAGTPLIPAFTLYAPDGEVIAEAAGTPSRPDEALLSGFALPVTGAYILFVRAAPGSALGAYLLSVSAGWALRDLEAGQVQPGGQPGGILVRSGDRDTWRIDLPASATVRVAVSALSPTLAPLVEVVSPRGETVVAMQGPAGGATREVEFFTDAAGEYRLRVSAFENIGAGRYTLSVTLVDVVPTATFAAVAFRGDITLAQGERYLFPFRAIPGQRVLIEARGADGFDPVVALYAPDGRRIALADDLSEGYPDAVLQAALNDGIGEYRVEVYGYALMPGAFVLRVRVD